MPSSPDRRGLCRLGRGDAPARPWRGRATPLHHAELTRAVPRTVPTATYADPSPRSARPRLRRPWVRRGGAAASAPRGEQGERASISIHAVAGAPGGGRDPARDCASRARATNPRPNPAPRSRRSGGLSAPTRIGDRVWNPSNAIDPSDAVGRADDAPSTTRYFCSMKAQSWAGIRSRRVSQRARSPVGPVSSGQNGEERRGVADGQPGGGAGPGRPWAEDTIAIGRRGPSWQRDTSCGEDRRRRRPRRRTQFGRRPRARGRQSGTAPGARSPCW